jgi:hypothetical protein
MPNKILDFKIALHIKIYGKKVRLFALRNSVLIAFQGDIQSVQRYISAVSCIRDGFSKPVTINEDNACIK